MAAFSRSRDVPSMVITAKHALQDLSVLYSIAPRVLPIIPLGNNSLVVSACSLSIPSSHKHTGWLLPCQSSLLTEPSMDW